ncbi:MAG: hypothetical protein PHQ62_02810 [Clostridia bacterium]|nr:hypothetical protein [Clostridia bacterium]
MAKYSKKITTKEKVLNAVDKINVVQGFKMGLDLAKSFESDLLYGFSSKEEKVKIRKKEAELEKQ